MAGRAGYKQVEKKKKMEEEANFTCCEHPELLENYCELCKVFLCEDCSVDHLDHLESLEAWDSLIKNYLLRLKNQEHRVKVLLSQSDNLERLRKMIYDKIETSSKPVRDKVEEFILKLKEETWEEISKDRAKLEDAEDVQALKDILKELDRVIDEIESKGETEKEAVLEILKRQVADNINVEINKFSGLKQGEMNFAKAMKEFYLPPDVVYDKFLEYIKPRAKDLTDKESMTQVTMRTKEAQTEGKFEMAHAHHHTEKRICFPNGSRVWKKNGIGWQSQCCALELPEFFEVTVRVNNFIDDTFAMIGVSKREFEKHCGFLSFFEGQYALDTDGNFYFNSGKGREFAQGKTLANKKGNGDQLTVRYGEDKVLLFTYNGVELPQKFPALEGPFFFCSCLQYNNSEIEITDVDDLATEK